MNGIIHNPGILVSRLSQAERSELLLALLKKPSSSPALLLSRSQLAAAESWLWQRAAQDCSPAQSASRIRIWFIFMLIRYGGLRLQEVLQLEEKDCSFQAGELRTGGRIVPLPVNACRQLAAFWTSWAGRLLPKPFLCDGSFVRRSLSGCARACGLEPALLNARSLRKQRRLELEAAGLHPHLTSIFLGQLVASPLFPDSMAGALIRSHIREEGKLKTSARNVFHGQVAEIEANGILVNVKVTTPQGVAVSAVITDTSCRNLGLAPGSPVNALIKAPWVTVCASPADDTDKGNCFKGTVEKIQSDALACELLISLPQGNQLCSLYVDGARPAGEIKEGSEVFACFSPFAVILTTD